MRTRTLVIAGVAALILLAGGLSTFILLHKNDAAPASNTTGNPFVFTPTESSAGTTQQRVLYAADGTKVTVPDFAQNAPRVVIGQTPNDVQFDLTPYPEYEPGTPYPQHEFDISFNEKDSEFLIVLNQEPLGHARSAAEAYLALKLGVSAKELCGFNVRVAVPYRVNERYSTYSSLGVSTCAGSVNLPI